MSITEIEHATVSLLVRSEIDDACEQLRTAHQETIYFERRVLESQSKLSDARIYLRATIVRMDAVLLGLRRS